MEIQFFDNRDDAPKNRDDVRILRARTEMAPEGRRVAVDMELTPFIERPTIEIRLVNDRGESAGLTNIIESLDRIIRVVMHMRDKTPAEQYQAQIRIYYAHIDENMKRQMVDELILEFAAIPGNEVNWTKDESGEEGG